jgi:ribose 5-phosphate isomerase B
MDLNMRVAVGADSRGFAMREHVIGSIQQLGHKVEVVETPEAQTAEYTEIAALVASCVHQGAAERGILIARTGMGVCIVANKFPGIRAAVCQDEFMAETSRHYLDVNILCVSAELVGEQMIGKIIAAWLAAPFEGGRHARRVDRICAIEREIASLSKEPDRKIES